MISRVRIVGGIGAMKLGNFAIILLSAAVIATPAFANWFDNFQVGENHKKMLGSTPSPTPDDLRAIGDSKLGVGRTYRFNPKNGHWREVRSEDEAKEAAPMIPDPDFPRPDDMAGVVPEPMTAP